MALPGLERTPFSAWRLLLVGLPVSLLSLADLYVLNAFGVTTGLDAIVRTIVYALGGYVGLTVLAYATPPSWTGPD